MAKAILVGNSKGGTGKSTIAQELAYALRDAGHEVGLMDADIDSANLATRLGVEERVTFEGDHTIKPVEHEGINIYSMENAFDDASFAQSGEFMREVVNNMVMHSNWGEIKYLVVDCPPGTSDVFEELVKALRANLLGLISVGQPDAVDDTARMVKVCNHNWVPIIGFIENMSGVVDSEGYISSPATGKEIYPFGKGNIEEFAEKAGGRFLGTIPLCIEKELISEYSSDAISNAVKAIEDAPDPKLPEDYTRNESFITNLWKGLLSGVKKLNSDLDIDALQDQYGVKDREPLAIELELSDASGLSSIMSKVILKGGDGEMNVMRPSTAKRKGIEPEGGISITSQDLYNAINGKKTVMRSTTGEVIEEPYSIIKAVQMGDADIWGDRTINRLSILDKVLSEAVPMDEIQKAITQTA